MKDLKFLVRPNIQALEPYSSARDEYKDTTNGTFLDANESPFNIPDNRYPDPHQEKLKMLLARIKGIAPNCIFLGNGSDEAIDLIYRVFCNPQRDNVVSLSPTYGMYEVAAHINDVEYRSMPLDENFGFNADRLLQLTNDRTKAIFLCSPNNPTGNLLPEDQVMSVIRRFPGMVVVDEAYIDFASRPSLLKQLQKFPNLIILQTFSKSWGAAGIRLGMAFAHPDIISLMNKVKYPYNVNVLTQREAYSLLKEHFDVTKWVRIIVEEKIRVAEALRQLPFCQHIYPSDANFLLVKMSDAQAIYDYLLSRHIIVRNRTHTPLCNNCLRITIGSTADNTRLLAALRQYTTSQSL